VPTFKYDYLFSETEGVVSMNGVPLEGVKVTRIYDEVIENTITDVRGYFYFSEGREYSFFEFISPPLIKQKIQFEYTDDYGSRTYVGWETTKSDYVKDSEVDGQLIFKCDLSKAESEHMIEVRLYKKIYRGLCEIK
jgi:hypothetical protein